MTKNEKYDRGPNGDLYCSPTLCGLGCTRAHYEKVKAKAQKLCARLGPAWKPNVHENLGWHYSASLGDVTVHESKHGCTAMYNGPSQFIGDDKDPRRAVVKAYAAAEKAVALQMAANAVVRKALLSVPRLPAPVG